MRLLYDIEADGLDDATKMYCCAFRDIDTGKTWTCIDTENIVQYLRRADLHIGFNICGYDLPLVERLTGLKVDMSVEKVCDLWEIAVTLNPNRRNSVDDWASRLYLPPKVLIPDDAWKSLPTELAVKRAERDVEIEWGIYLALLQEMKVNDYKEIWR